MITLINTHDFPPKGYVYVEPAINWRTTSELAMMGLQAVATALQTARMQNPTSGLNPDYGACVEAIKAFQCERLKNNPTALEKFCGVESDASIRARTSGRKCASCGKR